MKKIGFVVPWYGDNIPGGAEMEARDLIKHLIGAGMDMEILTTCVKEFTASWNEDFYEPGLTTEGGVPVRRFRVKKRDEDLFNRVNIKLMNGERIRRSEEEIFVREMVNSTDLYAYMEEHQEEYDLFVFIPYMFGTTYYGVQVCPEKSIMIPCFHEEAYVHMQLFNEAFSNVAGMVYNAAPEKELTNEVFDLGDMSQIVMGIGMDTGLTSDADRFRQKFGIQDDFILYAGRKDVGKNIYLLIQYFGAYKRLHKEDKLKLVLIGGGKVTIPEELKDEIIDLGFVDIQDKYDAYAAALTLCQPSVHESFSLVIMESWLCKRPVLVHEDCAVTKQFAIDSNGGLYFTTYPEFEACIDFYRENEEAAKEMAENGRAYVMNMFHWDVIIDKYKKFFAEVIAKREAK